MSKQLLQFVRDFLGSESNAVRFCDSFIEQWRQERNSEKLLLDDSKTSESLSSIFCIVDLFNPNEDREDYELDEKRLRVELSKILNK